MFWMRNKEIDFQCAQLSGGLPIASHYLSVVAECAPHKLFYNPDPGQDPHCPDLGPNCLKWLSVAASKERV